MIAPCPGLCIGAASGLAKMLFVAGAATLATSVLSAIAEEARTNRDRRMPIGTFAKVSVGTTRKFLGICQAGLVAFSCDGQGFSVPLDRVNLIRGRLFLHRYRIELIDGSEYEANRIHTKSFSFLTMAGEQNVDFFEERIVTEEHRETRERQALFGLITFTEPHLRTVQVLRDFERRDMVVEGVVPEDLATLKRRLEVAVKNDLDGIISAVGRKNLARFFLL